MKNQGGHEYTQAMRAVRPKHAKGEFGSPEWCKDCDDVFVRHMLNLGYERYILRGNKFVRFEEVFDEAV